MRLIFEQECRQTARHPAQYLQPLLFYIFAVLLFPLALGQDANLLQRAAIGILWVPIILTHFATQDQLFSQDLQNGVSEQWLLSPHPFSLLLLAKVAAHWLFHHLPLILTAPLLGYVWLQLEGETALVLAAGLLLTSPVLSLLGAIVGALTAGLRHSSLLLTLVLLPLCVPLLIFGAGVAYEAQTHMPYHGLLALLGAIFFLALSLCPMAISAALRLSLSE
jgi:heme exporter protein B